MKHANNCGRRGLSALLALLMCLPVMTGVTLTATAADDLKFSDDFNVSLDFEDLTAETELSASYVNKAIAHSDFASEADSSNTFSPTRWKAVTDPVDSENTVIGLVKANSYGGFRIVDKKKQLYEKAYVINFRLMLNQPVNQNTALLGLATSTGSRTRILGINGTELCYGLGPGKENENEKMSIDGTTVRLTTGQWYEFKVIVKAQLGEVQVFLDGKHIYEFVHADILSTKPSYSAYNICYGYSNGIFDAYIDDISLRSLDEKWVQEQINAALKEKEEKAKEQERKRAEYVMPTLEKYCKAFTYLEDDGVIGIPAGLTAYYKGEQTHADTSVVFYIMGYVGAREVGKGDTLSILNELLDEGYIVVTLDYKGNPKAKTPDLDWSIHGLRQKLSNFTGGLPIDYYESYIVPDGYKLARNIVFYDIGENGRMGTLDKIIEIYNGSKFRDAKGSKIPNKNEKVTTIDRCLKPDGTPIDLQMKMDIIYPVNPDYEAPMVMISSSAETRMGVCSRKSLRPLDVGPVMRGCAVAIYDHIYTPMARDDHYGYFSGTFSLQDLTGVSSHTQASRAIHYYADKFGYSKENYAVMGHSKGSWCGLLAHENPETLTEKNKFGGYVDGETYGEQGFLVYEDGTPIKSGVQVAYRSMGQGNQWSDKYLADSNAPTMRAVGVLDDSVLLFDDWYPEGREYEASGVEYLSILMTDAAHDYPYGIDPWYNYDRWETFMAFLMYHLKGDEAPRLLYSSIQNGKVVGDLIVVRNDGKGGKYQYHTETPGDEIFVQFLAPVTDASAKAGIALYDVTAGKAVDMTLRRAGDGNKWYVEPKSDLTAGNKYELRVDGSVIKSELNGIAVGESAVYDFVA